MSKTKPETPKEHDLSHERDRRCVPLVKEIIKIFNDMPEIPTGSHVNEKEVMEKNPYLEPSKKVIQFNWL